MTSLDDIRDRLRAFRNRNAIEQEMDEELRFHLEMATERNLARGLAPGEARRQALVEFGGVMRYKEAARAEVSSRWVDNAWQDLRFAVRTIRRAPGFAASVVLTLSLGMGAATAIFSVVNGVVLRPLPFPEPHRLVFLGWQFEPGRMNNALTAYQVNWVREHSKSIDGVTTYRGFEQEIGDPALFRTARGLNVSEDFFQVVGIAPNRGRAFTAPEARPGGDPVVILSDAVWRRELGADPGAIGREIRLGATSYTVVGVMPPEFRFPPDPGYTDVLLPLRLEPDIQDEGHNYQAFARLRTGWSGEAAAADLVAVSRMLRADHPELFDRADEGIHVLSFQDVYVAHLRTMLWLLLGAVGCVLLIACANAANLLLARAVSREREIMLRAAIGAGRGRILRQLLIEGLAISLAAGVIGTAIGMWSVRALLALAPRTLPRADEIGLDHRVLAFTFAVVGVTGIFFGLVAAIPTARLNLASALGARSRSTTGRTRLRDVLVVAETAFAVVLLAGAGLLIASFGKLRGVDPGFSAESVLATRFVRMPRDYIDEKRWTFERALLERVRAIPGVDVAGGVTSFPLEGGGNIPVAVEGQPERSAGDVDWRGITPGALEALRVPMRRGRVFTESDLRASARVAIVNEEFAKRFFPNEDAIGKRVEIGIWKGRFLSPGFAGAAEIVGVVADMRERRVDLPIKQTIFVPLDQWPGMINRVNLVVRTGQPLAIRRSIESAARDLDGRVAPPTFEMLSNIVGASMAEQRFQMVLLTIFAGSALFLTAIGIFAVVSYSVHERVREIGVRVALGARTGTVLRLVVGRGMLLAGVGSAIGVAAGLASSRVLATTLYGVTTTEPGVFLAAVGVLLMIALAAAWIPAHRATRIDPMEALRAE